ncbi:MAG TPA: NnrU family protein [Rhizomicrobium sp.]|nr:NnrU family protein [Rhizomicrobium sp.]
MNSLIAAAAAFLAIHILVSGTRLRDAIVARTGEGPYLGLFSLASLGVIVWLCVAYNSAQTGGDPVFYDLGHVRDLGIPVVLIAFWLGIQGLLMPNPTSLRQEAAAEKAGTIRGVLRITRHPFLWGVALWSGFHLAANGDEASSILFGTFFVTAILGTFAIDAKRRRKMGDKWKAFAEKTSNIPFAAVLSGRNALNLSESFGWRGWLAILIFAAVLFAHAHVFGASPFPGGAVPI